MMTSEETSDAQPLAARDEGAGLGAGIHPASALEQIRGMGVPEERIRDYEAVIDGDELTWTVYALNIKDDDKERMCEVALKSITNGTGNTSSADSFDVLEWIEKFGTQVTKDGEVHFRKGRCISFVLFLAEYLAVDLTPLIGATVRELSSANRPSEEEFACGSLKIEVMADYLKKMDIVLSKEDFVNSAKAEAANHGLEDGEWFVGTFTSIRNCFHECLRMQASCVCYIE
eukprot:TRINITY_DN17363_c0_g1_i1.p1 TRINITY_DN17363_c0_g1~~TRINITY_DN17363_c0_g1_i1.p1  ORF type:complete len:230 (+),score=59.57 TRINITY_DN17363_c0_g1_i1:150-839(+)